MKERPIIFNPEMVRALRRGRKTQTRRVVKEVAGESWRRAEYREHAGAPWRSGWWFIAGSSSTGPVPCPYGQPGDRLYVREACWIWGRWSRNGSTKTGRQRWRFTADSSHRVCFNKPVLTAKREAFDGHIGRPGWVYRHARFMPRWACRTLLEITNVRVERVQEISSADAKAEGVSLPASDCFKDINTGTKLRYEFEKLWDSINAARGFGWSANPYVWIIEFRKVGI